MKYLKNMNGKRSKKLEQYCAPTQTKFRTRVEVQLDWAFVNKRDPMVDLREEFFFCKMEDMEKLHLNKEDTRVKTQMEDYNLVQAVPYTVS